MKPGLHKNVASIFDGVEIPGKLEDDEHLNDAAVEPGGDTGGLAEPLPFETPDSSAVTVEQTEQEPDSQSPQTQTDSQPEEQLQSADVEQPQSPPVLPFVVEQEEALEQEEVSEQKEIVEQEEEIEDAPTEPLKEALPAVAIDMPAEVEKPRRDILGIGSLKSRLLGDQQGTDLKKRIVMIALVPVLAIVLMAVFAQNLRALKKKVNTSIEVQEQIPLSVVTPKINWQIPEPYPATLRDPMQFGSVAAGRRSGIGGLVVKGVLYSSDRPAAIINNKIVHIGDEVLGATIVNINADSVEFEMDGKKWTQEVRP